VKLKDLLDEAVRIAEEDLAARLQRPDGVAGLTAEEREVARVVGISAVNYVAPPPHHHHHHHHTPDHIQPLSPLLLLWAGTLTCP
jgi:arginyl-tRNA synthetase